MSETIARKILHIVAISISAVSPYFIPHHILVIVVGVAVPVLFFLVKYGFFIDADQGRKSWGIVYFAAVLLTLLLLFPKNNELVFFPMLVLALADGFATIVGNLFGKRTFSFGEETKSWEGSTAFLFFTILSFEIIPKFLPFIRSPFDSFSALIIVSVFLTLLEALSIKGRDNIWVPLAVAYWILLDTTFINLFSLALIVVITAIVFFTYKKRWLTSAGAVATFLLGCLLLISPEPKWIIPALFFFVAGSLISFLPKSNKEESLGGRTANQVFYNGGIATVFISVYFLTNQFMFLIGGLSALSAAMSDTSSSEIGSRYGRKTYNILTGKKVISGLSGGVSLVGMGAGFVFTALFSLISIGLMDSSSWKLFLILLISGMAGNIMDSLLGALLQVKYRSDSTAQWSDFPTESPNQEMMGFRFITNDIVNLLTTIFAAFLGLLLYNLL
ncbi:DUF92 domain-containing protein [Cryomorpha ignava]|uniref:DUF92 domain-containing protein n=1 Tax=Cryomorpha ignava TaxID=101383 RepID=A0A7K3WMP8_9FLAO|nr:DUF92 domain-containing protein [Cryomorpha ignava]